MAQVNKLAPFILKWEGGFVNDPHDRGGATNMGVTIATYEAYCRRKGYPHPTIQRLKNLSDEEWVEILKTMYWDKWQADNICSQSVANMLVDWLWASGGYAIRRVQQMLGVQPDGVVGSVTLAAINGQDAADFFARLKAEREQHFRSIVKRNPSQAKFLRGWMNRLNDLKYTK